LTKNSKFFSIHLCLKCIEMIETSEHIKERQRVIMIFKNGVEVLNVLKDKEIIDG